MPSLRPHQRTNARVRACHQGLGTHTDTEPQAQSPTEHLLEYGIVDTLADSLEPLSLAISYTVNILLFTSRCGKRLNYVRHLDVNVIHHDFNVCASVFSSGPTDGLVYSVRLRLSSPELDGHGRHEVSVGYFPQSPYRIRELAWPWMQSPHRKHARLLQRKDQVDVQ